MPEATGTYEPRDPAQSVLFQVVRDHFESFRAQAASLPDGEGLPRFVEREFREFLTCGCLAAGFARFHCDACGHDRLVPFLVQRTRLLSELRRATYGGTRGPPHTSCPMPRFGSGS